MTITEIIVAASAALTFFLFCYAVLYVGIEFAAVACPTELSLSGAARSLDWSSRFCTAQQHSCNTNQIEKYLPSSRGSLGNSGGAETLSSKTEYILNAE